MATEALEGIITLFHRLPLFSQLTSSEQMELSSMVYVNTYEPGEFIFQKGEPGRALYIILSGMVRISLTSQSRGEAVLAIVGRGEFLGELSFLDGQIRDATAVALDTTETLVLNRDDFLPFIEKHPGVALEILSVLSGRIRKANNLISDCHFLDVRSRVAKKLLELADIFGHHVAGGTEIDFRLNQQDLADMVGTTRESVNRALSVLAGSGVITMDRQKIIVLSRDGLRRSVLSQNLCR